MPVEVQVADALGSVVVSEPLLDSGYFDEVLQNIRAVVDDPRLTREVCVRVCDKVESQHLNLSFRGKDKPTNVLSFPADLEVDPGLCPDDELPLGDLVICWPLVEEEAKDQGKAMAAHFTHLFVHGVLHLLGFDHEMATAAQQMETLEINILEGLHITNPYEA
jgi:probable rRNA maturation factor